MLIFPQNKQIHIASPLAVTLLGSGRKGFQQRQPHSKEFALLLLIQLRRISAFRSVQNIVELEKGKHPLVVERNCSNLSEPQIQYEENTNIPTLQGRHGLQGRAGLQLTAMEAINTSHSSKSVQKTQCQLCLNLFSEPEIYIPFCPHRHQFCVEDIRLHVRGELSRKCVPCCPMCTAPRCLFSEHDVQRLFGERSKEFLLFRQVSTKKVPISLARVGRDCGRNCCYPVALCCLVGYHVRRRRSSY